MCSERSLDMQTLLREIKDIWQRETRTQGVKEKGSDTEEARCSDKGSEAGREKRERKVVKQ